MCGDESRRSGLVGTADPASAEWIRSLTSGGAEYEQACDRLHALLLRVALAEVRRRGPRSHIAGPELDDIAHQAAADALMAITRKIGEFRGESRFTTWAFKFAILEVSNKLGRHFWRTRHAALDAEDWDRLPDRFGIGPDEATEARELLTALRQAVDEVLTDHQRRIFVALVLGGVPLDALVAELGTNRNAVYKTMFDARRKLRSRLVAGGYLDHDTARRS
ncbi:sigma-70 family RNA polymerase sigma factor [Saccharopolyspora sp. K220]|uniref:RNA polymerase sigma factor n=1 Tax=Saccharopolyspora soli TaxID=2926618 RepID=UPI001F588AA3|nr:sigma-70 family RNA polymerase sigma factor [Saccharopolyspora soli]MCI2423191.1 sigma-70 family RNA polymerase sigma factor [Saccharopolyspora soli]